jgi:hypothetical protein
VYVLKTEEGGRHTPFFNNYRPQFYFRTTDVTGTVTLQEGVEMVMPGDNTKFDVELVSPIACEEGLRFAIREGGKTVGAGVVTKIVELASLGVNGPGPSGPGFVFGGRGFCARPLPPSMKRGTRPLPSTQPRSIRSVT